MNRKTAINALIVSRIAFGIAAWLLPRPAARAFGFDMSRNPQLPYLARLIGTRDVILAYGLLTTEEMSKSDGCASTWPMMGLTPSPPSLGESAGTCQSARQPS